MSRIVLPLIPTTDVCAVAAHDVGVAIEVVVDVDVDIVIAPAATPTPNHHPTQLQ